MVQQKDSQYNRVKVTDSDTNGIIGSCSSIIKAEDTSGIEIDNGADTKELLKDTDVDDGNDSITQVFTIRKEWAEAHGSVVFDGFLSSGFDINSIGWCGRHYWGILKSQILFNWRCLLDL